VADGAAQWIETVPKVGYRFTPEVTRVPWVGRDQEPARADPVAAVLGSTDGLVVPERSSAPSRLARFLSTPAARATLLLTTLAAVAVAAFAGRAATRTAVTVPASRLGTTATPLTSYPGPEASPSLSPDGTQVAFSRRVPGDGFNDIFVKLVGDGEPVRLTNGPRSRLAPSWSPDGRWLAFLRQPLDGSPWDLVVMPSLGGTERRVASLRFSTTTLDHPGTNLLSWTPDGKWLALGAVIDEQAGIWLVEVDGPGRRRLTQTPPRLTDRSPKVAADGTRVAFIRAGPISHAALLVVPLGPDLTPRGAPRQVIDPWPRYVGSVAWGADQASLVYAVGGHMGMSRLELVRLKPDGMTPVGPSEALPFGDQATGLTVAASGRLVYVRRLRDSGFWTLDLEDPSRGETELSALGSSLDEHTPHYSPDGRRLVFASTRSGTEEIWIADVDGSNPRKMTSMGGPLCANPQWSPDGRQVVFNSAKAGSSNLYLLDPEAGSIRRLTSAPGWEEQPRWSRDGRWIYFAAQAEGQPRSEIWKISSGGGEVIQVTTGGGLMAEESHDGRALYVARAGPTATALWRVPLDAGPESRVADDLAGSSLNFVVGRKTVYFLAAAKRPPFLSIVAIDIATGRRATLAPFGKSPWFGMTLSPDERRLLVSAVNSVNLDLMLVDPPATTTPP
jgi:Tol biopolymer transport system component